MVGWILVYATLANAAPCQAGDTDGDTLLDSAEDINLDGDCDNDDTDADGTANYLDIDDDNDGVDTNCEINFGAGYLVQDTDGDTILDGEEWYNTLDPTLPAGDYRDYNGGFTGFTCFDPWDRDSDQLINALDTDDDGDGHLTSVEGTGDVDCAFPALTLSPDGIPNYLDYDSDNDTLLDGTETFGDADADQLPDIWDCDNSGCADDTDMDAVQNCDERTLCPLADPYACGIDPDVDDDGVTDGLEIVNVLAPQNTDADGDLDAYDEDDDGDGVPTLLETGFDCPDGEAWELTFDVAAGWTHLCPLSGTIVTAPFRDTDGDLVPDYLDNDDDDDGVPTADEDRNNNGDWFDDDEDGDSIPDFLDAPDITTDTGSETHSDSDTDSDVPSDSAEVDSGDEPKDGGGGCGCGHSGGGPWLGWIIMVAAAARGRRQTSP